MSEGFGDCLTELEIEDFHVRAVLSDVGGLPCEGGGRALEG